MTLLKNKTSVVVPKHKKSVWLKCCGLLLLSFVVVFANAQADDAQLSKSNNYIFEGNSLVDENFIEAEKKYRLGVSAKENNVTGVYNLGNAYYNSKLYDEAMLRHLEAVNNSSSKLC